MRYMEWFYFTFLASLMVFLTFQSENLSSTYPETPIIHLANDITRIDLKPPPIAFKSQPNRGGMKRPSATAEEMMPGYISPVGVRLEFQDSAQTLVEGSPNQQEQGTIVQSKSISRAKKREKTSRYITSIYALMFSLGVYCTHTVDIVLISGPWKGVPNALTSSLGIALFFHIMFGCIGAARTLSTSWIQRFVLAILFCAPIAITWEDTKTNRGRAKEEKAEAVGAIKNTGSSKTYLLISLVLVVVTATAVLVLALAPLISKFWKDGDVKRAAVLLSYDVGRLGETNSTSLISRGALGYYIPMSFNLSASLPVFLKMHSAAQATNGSIFIEVSEGMDQLFALSKVNALNEVKDILPNI
ncbi:hypothetical protein HDU67_000818 [Dinochytrium kinnereticum]|nr:hypothetical protein HDU67_000818 [Dinochytrium kinnereticum]